jgi:hypothetical protein
MANLVKLKRSAVAGKVPLTTDLQLGELAVNTYDGKLYTKKDDGTASVVEVGAGGAQAGAGGAIVETKNSISANYTLTTDFNGITAGPVTIASGVTVTVPAGASWVIV